MKRCIATAVLLCTLFCTTFAQLRIKAHITGFADGTKFYLRSSETDSFVDSALIKNNAFSLNAAGSNEPKSYWVQTTTDNDFFYTVLFAGNDKIEIKGDRKDMPFAIKITGSKSQDDFNRLYANIGPLYKKRNALVQQWSELKKDDSTEIKSKAIWKVIGRLDSVERGYRSAFIKQNLNSYLAADELFSMRNIIGKDSLQRLFSTLEPQLQQSLYGKRITTYL